MQNSIIITLLLGSLLSCNFQNSTADLNTDRGKDGLKGEVVAVYHEYQDNAYFTEYDINGRKLGIYIDDNNSKLPAEKQFNFAEVVWS